MNPLARTLREAFPALRLTENEPMKHHCSFRTGGPAAVFAEPSSEAELTALLAFLREQNIPPVLLGNGTNVLVPDAGLSGVVVHLGEGFGDARFDGDTVCAQAGISLSRLAVLARDHGLSGLEFAHGIPGSLGGGVLMNAGAYGGELKDAVVSVRYLDEAGTLRETEDPGFAYRHSRFMDTGGVILGARLRLTPGDPAAIGGRMRELMEKRSASQPLDKPSAGSTFQRPQTGYAAAMIDGAGLKGFRIGGAQVSEKHAGFVINAGGATSADILRLMEYIQNAVEKKYGVRLEPEVRILG